MFCVRDCGNKEPMIRDDDSTFTVKVLKCTKCGARFYPGYPLPEDDRNEQANKIRDTFPEELTLTGQPIYCLDCLEQGKQTIIGYVSEKNKNLTNQRKYCPEHKKIRAKISWNKHHMKKQKGNVKEAVNE